MQWRYEVRMERVDDNQHPMPKFILTNGVDAEIICGGARHPTFLYRRPDLSFEMTGTQDLRQLPRSQWPKTDVNMSLGPTCSLHLKRKSLSRELTLDDYPRIAADFKEALSHYLELPGSRPPVIERVIFYDDFLAPYSD